MPTPAPAQPKPVGPLPKLKDAVPLNSPDALDYWKDRFQSADPNRYHQFKNKTPAHKDRMAVAALRSARQKGK